MSLILWEVWSYVQLPIFWWLFRRFAKRNVLGDMIAGTIIGAFLEFATEPLWDYHFKLTIYKDTPLSVVLGWGVLFTLTTFASEKLYCKVLRRSSILPYDNRIFLFDVVASVLISFPLEALGVKAGIWDYRYDRLGWNWGMVPLVRMPYEALVGYALLMLVAPTYVRYWQGYFAASSAAAPGRRAWPRPARRHQYPEPATPPVASGSAAGLEPAGIDD